MFRKPERKDFHTCEYCKVRPCMFLAKGEQEYKTFCRHYKADTQKIEKEKRR